MAIGKPNKPLSREHLEAAGALIGNELAARDLESNWGKWNEERAQGLHPDEGSKGKTPERVAAEIARDKATPPTTVEKGGNEIAEKVEDMQGKDNEIVVRDKQGNPTVSYVSNAAIRKKLGPIIDKMDKSERGDLDKGYEKAKARGFKGPLEDFLIETHMKYQSETEENTTAETWISGDTYEAINGALDSKSDEPPAPSSEAPSVGEKDVDPWEKEMEAKGKGGSKWKDDAAEVAEYRKRGGARTDEGTLLQPKEPEKVAAGMTVGEFIRSHRFNLDSKSWEKFNAARRAARGAARRATKSAVAEDPDGASQAHGEASARLREAARATDDAGTRILYERGAQVHDDAATAHRDVRDGVGDPREAMKRSEDAENITPKGEEREPEPDAPSAAAGRSRTFASSADAYDDCQTDDTIKNGDALVVDSEGVVGVAWTWPLAVTAKNGELHTITDTPGAVDRVLADAKISRAQVQSAVDIARKKGYPVSKIFKNYLWSQREQDGDKFVDYDD